MKKFVSVYYNFVGLNIEEVSSYIDIHENG